MMVEDNNNSFEIIGKIISINKNKDYLNLNIIDLKNKEYNIIIEDKNKEFFVNQIYKFNGTKFYKEGKEKIYYSSKEEEILKNDSNLKEVLEQYNHYYDLAPTDILKIKDKIEKKIFSFKNEIIKNLTISIYNDYKDLFYMHPAGLRFHHSYIGGLCYHTFKMMEVGEKLGKLYPFINEDLLLSSIILHDIAKIDEFSGIEGEYTKEGSLIGHINMGSNLIAIHAKELGIEKADEVLCLKHLILSHHGIPMFGSPKKPQLAEAILLWIIDTLDSKLCVVGEELEKIKPGEFTNNIAVCDKVKIYKPKFYKK